MASEKLNEAIKAAFKKNGLDRENFNHDITSFNEDGRKCMAIFDNGDCSGRVFLLIGLSYVKGEWIKAYFKHTSDNAGCYDGIDAMCDASIWLGEIN